MQRNRVPALLLAIAVGGVWAWWGAKSGAYFGSVFYPGAIVLAVLVLALAIGAPLRFRPRREAPVALGLLLALGAWTLVSFFWAPVPRTATADAAQILAYATAFALGLWLRGLSRDALLALAPLAIGAAGAGLVAVLALAGGHHLTAYLHPDASFRFPLGYRNANAAFFLIALWPALTLAASPLERGAGSGRAASSANLWLRAGALGVATLCIDLAVLSQSRGSEIAFACSLVIVFALSPWRLRLAAYLGLAALPVLPILPVLLDVYQHGAIAGVLPLLRDSAVAVVLSVVAAVALGAVAVRVERGIRLSERAARRAERWFAAAAAALALAGLTVFVVSKGGPARFVDQRVREFTEGGYPDLHDQGARFGANVGSNRNDFWRVSLKEGARRPLLGGGAGSFQFDYLRERRSHETPTDPHSVEMLMLTELGLPGLLLFAGFVVAAATGIVRSRAASPALAAAALASGAYWLIHSSYDWFWNYPALTAPAIFLLGAAIGGPLRTNPDPGVEKT